MIDGSDVAEIVGLYARYCHHFDNRDAAAAADCFAEDCAFVTSNQALAGRDAVLEYAQLCADTRPLTRHQTTDHLVESIDGRADAARARAYFTFSFLEDGVLVPVVTGIYEDEFVKADGRWWITRHEVRVDGPPARPVPPFG